VRDPAKRGDADEQGGTAPLGLRARLTRLNRMHG